MLSDKQIESYLANLENKLFKDRKQSIKLSREWIKRKFQSEPGVYIVFEHGKLVYVGETGNIRKRIRDLLDTRNHTLRRSIGKRHFAEETGYKDASSSRKFPEHIERKIIDYMEKNLKICALPINVGRKELEERIQDKYRGKLYNQRSRRAA